VVTEYVQRAAICRHRLVRKKAGDDLPQQFPLLKIGSYIRRRCSFLHSLSIARTRS
jgi:hypothetical protein